jgi:hypothetical protein
MANLREKTSGFGLVRFDKRKRTITCECWPLDDIGGRSMETWPVVTTQRDQYGRQAKAHLPTLRFTDTQTAVVEVIDARSGELIYSVRLNTAEWQPHVFAEGEYNLRLLEPEAGPKAIKELTGLRAQKDNREVIEISLA